jgi:hypothetical protein
MTGNVFDKLMIGTEEYWNINKFKPYRVVEVENPLPSDSTYRNDSLQLLQGDLPKAQVCKDELENIQRRDRKLRAAWEQGLPMSSVDTPEPQKPAEGEKKEGSGILGFLGWGKK